MGEGTCGHGSISGLNLPYSGLGLPRESRSRPEDRLGLRLGMNMLTSQVLGV